MGWVIVITNLGWNRDLEVLRQTCVHLKHVVVVSGDKPIDDIEKEIQHP